jgi:hypothetical protein
MSTRRTVFCLIICTFLFAQHECYFVTSTNSDDATAYSNSHKIATHRGELPHDTIHFVYHDSDSIYYTSTLDHGASWLTPYVLCSGQHPALDIDDSEFRHITYQQIDTVDSNYDVFYDCLDDWAPPVNISESANNSTLPDVVLDDHQTAHIVWVEEFDDYPQIYYRTCVGGMPGDTMRISDFGSAEAIFSYPSISLFGPNSRIYVAWDCFDSASYSPYQIHVRYKQGATWSPVETYAHYLPLRHSSLDYGHGGMDSISLCYEDSTSGNLEATFVGGNGGGYATPGKSSYPVMTTINGTWSYLYWQEDSAGYEDIYYHLYYFNAGWNRGSVRSSFAITESIRYPNSCGAYLVWTQGDTPPYSIWFANFGYPIAVKETDNVRIIAPAAFPNPFQKQVTITWTGTQEWEGTASIYDISGRLVQKLKPAARTGSACHVTWCGNDERGNRLPAGAYLCVLNTEGAHRVVKVLKID